MSLFKLNASQAPAVWLEPHRIYAEGSQKPLAGTPTGDQLAQALTALPLGPTAWIVDDLYAPSLILRDIVELPSGDEARDAFFRWRFNQHLALDTPHAVQGISLGDGAWLLAGISEALRDVWMQEASHLGRPIHSLMPRWLWLYNRLAPTRENPGLLLSLCPHPGGTYTGTLVAWGRTLTLLRQWSDPATPEVWNNERVTPSAAFLQRESRSPHDLTIWGATDWPTGTVPHKVLPMELPVLEAL